MKHTNTLFIVVFSIVLGALPQLVHAEQSASYQLLTTTPNEASQNTAGSNTYSLNDTGINWYETPATGTTAQVVHPTFVPSSSSVPSSDTSNSQGESPGSQTSPGGSRGHNGSFASRGSASSSSRSTTGNAHSASQESSQGSSEESVSHPAASSSPGTATMTPSLPTILEAERLAGSVTIVPGIPYKFFGGTDSTAQIIFHCAANETSFEYVWDDARTRLMKMLQKISGGSIMLAGLLYGLKKVFQRFELLLLKLLFFPLPLVLISQRKRDDRMDAARKRRKSRIAKNRKRL